MSLYKKFPEIDFIDFRGFISLFEFTGIKYRCGFINYFDRFQKAFGVCIIADGNAFIVLTIWRVGQNPQLLLCLSIDKFFCEIVLAISF